MRYIEKQYAAPAQPSGWAGGPQPQFASYADYKRHMDGQVFFMRKMMGGNSRDITRRPILMEDRQVPGYREPVRVRLYTPKDPSPTARPLVAFFHGGGWMGGSLWAVEEHAKAVSDRLDALVMSVQYHLAPEHPFPWGLMDCYQALLWAWDNAGALGADRHRFIVSGDSAGGNFAAAIALMARDSGRVKLRYQLLLYPAVTLAPGQFAMPQEGPADMARVMLDWYVQDGTDPADPRISPMAAGDLSDLPDALMVSCELDGLKAQDALYAAKLDAAGNRVTHIFYRGTPHAFIDDTGNLPQAEDLVDEIVKFVKG